MSIAGALDRDLPLPLYHQLQGVLKAEIESGKWRPDEQLPNEAKLAERYGVSPSVVVLWVQRFEQTESVAAKPSGGSTSPLEEHAGFLLGLITEQRI